MANKNDRLTYSIALTYAIDMLTSEDSSFVEQQAKFSKEEMVEKLVALRTAQEKRSNADRKPTEKENEIADLRESLYALLVSAGKPMTVSEIMGVDVTFGAMSNQRIAALLRGLMTAGRVVRTEEKRKAYFSAC